MKSENRPVTDAELHAWVDGQLSDERRQQVEKWLHQRPEQLARVQAWQQQREDLQKIYPLESTAPQHSLPKHRFSSAWRAAAAVVLLAAGVATGWWGRGFVQPSYVQQQLMQPARFAHNMYSTDPQRPVELDAASVDTLGHWIRDRMQRQIDAPSLRVGQFQLLGGRLLPSTDRMAVQYMYQDAQGERVTLYIRRGNWDKSAQLATLQADGLYTLLWAEGELGYALTGQIDPERLQSLMLLVRQQSSPDLQQTVWRDSRQDSLMLTTR